LAGAVETIERSFACAPSFGNDVGMPGVSERRLVTRASRWVACVLLAVSLAVVAISPADADGNPSKRSPALAFDFNGDGFADLAAGIPNRSVAGAEYAGAIGIVYGSSGGLSSFHSQFLTQDSPGIKGRAHGWAFFGLSTTSGDFDGDGYADLAIQAAEDVLVVFGGRHGLTTRDRLLRVGRFGLSTFGLGTPPLATGDFDGDGLSDLVVSSPGGEDESGAIVVFPGSSTGISTQNARRITRDTRGVPGNRFPDDHFGAAIAVGDVTGDGYDDLTVTSEEDEAPGTIHLFPGSPFGVDATGDSVLQTGAVLNTPYGVHAGEPLAVADFDSDGFGDLVVGTPNDCYRDPHDDCGAVVIFSGSVAGISTRNRQIWDQDSPGVPGAAEPIDQFGSTVAVGDLNGDSHADLAIGVPSEGLGKVRRAGAVNILYGSRTGLTGTGAQFWSQRSFHIKGVPIHDDSFSSGLIRILNFGKGSQPDLAVHSPDDRLKRPDEPSGSVNVFYSTSGGITRADQLWHSNSAGMAGRAQVGEDFGGNCCSTNSR
jgi:hypothetical protein